MRSDKNMPISSLWKNTNSFTEFIDIFVERANW